MLPFLAAALLAVAAAAPAPGATLPATGDVVAAPCPFPGVAVARLGAWAWRDPGWEVIPFQVDPRTPAGDWAFGRAPLARTAVHDEVVVATADLGRPAPPGRRPPGALEVAPLGGAGGVAYLCLHAGDAPRSHRRWLAYDREREEVVHDGFTLGFERRRPFVLDRLVWHTDPEGRDWLDTGKFRATGRLFGTFRFHRTREDFSSRTTGVIEGPVRVVVRTENRLRMAFGLKSPRSIVDRIHTPRALRLALTVHIPFRVGWFFSGLTVRSTLDLAPGARRTITCPNHATTPIDGRPEPSEVALLGCPLEGFTIDGPHGSLHGTLSLGPKLHLKAAIYFKDDLHEPDPPERVPGHLGESGVLLTGWERLGRGDYHLTMLLEMAPRGRATAP